MTARNDVTGDAIQTREASEAFRTGWERIFGRQATPVASPTGEAPTGAPSPLEIDS